MTRTGHGQPARSGSLRSFPRSIALLVIVGSAVHASAASAQSDIVGTWRGTSTCVNKQHWPACHDEQVIYEVRPKPGARDSVTLRADKLVNGEREFMGESDFAPAADGSWISELQMGSSRGRIVLRIAGTHMTGTLAEVSSGLTVRDLVLDRVQ